MCFERKHGIAFTRSLTVFSLPLFNKLNSQRISVGNNGVRLVHRIMFSNRSTTSSPTAGPSPPSSPNHRHVNGGVSYISTDVDLLSSAIIFIHCVRMMRTQCRFLAFQCRFLALDHSCASLWPCSLHFISFIGSMSRLADVAMPTLWDNVRVHPPTHARIHTHAHTHRLNDSDGVVWGLG